MSVGKSTMNRNESKWINDYHLGKGADMAEMSEKKPTDKILNQPDEQLDQLSTPDDESTSDSATAMGHNSEQQELTLTKKEAAAYLDMVQRLKAEFDNFRKRTLRERTLWEQNCRIEVIAKFLPILDNLERGLAVAHQNETPVSFTEGQELIVRQFLSILEELGAKRIESIGRPFDPLVHDAISTIAVEGEEPGLIAQEMLSGFEIDGRVIRAARVVVSS